MKYEIAANICRICLTKNKKLRSLYKPSDEDEIPPNEMIEKVTGICVEEMLDLPILPKNICKNCELSLSMAYEFCVKALESKRILDLYLSSLNKVQQTQQKGHESEERDPVIKEELDEFIEMQHLQVDVLDENFVECAMQLLPTDIVNKDWETNNQDQRNTEQIHEICRTETEEDVVKDADDETMLTDETLYDSKDNEEDDIIEEHLEMERLSQIELSNFSENQENNIPLRTNKDITTIKSSDDDKLQAGTAAVIKGTKNKNKKRTSSSKTEFGHICDICGNVYAKRGRMMEHRQRHDKELKYACELCDKKFHMRELLRKHMYSHNGGKPLKCDYCSRTFYYESVRKAHENVHKGLRPFVCDVCGKSFCYAHTLKKHKLIHAEIKQYRCNYCNKNFRLQHHMKQHELTKLHKNSVMMAKSRRSLNCNINEKTSEAEICTEEESHD